MLASYESFADDTDSNYGHESVGPSTKIRLMENFIGSGHFPFGAQIDSSTTELSLNRLRVTAMAKILYERTLQRIPGNTNEAIENVVTKFSHYVNLFGNLPNLASQRNEHHLHLRMHIFYFLYHLFFYIYKDECVFSEIDQKQDQERLGGSIDLTSRARSDVLNRKRGLLHNSNSYLHKILGIFIQNLH